jgi:hypothetical protein
MNNEQARQRDLVDTTDCLEAVGVFRCWKNFFFVILLFAMLLLGLCFWVLDLGLVGSEQQDEEIIVSAPLAGQENQSEIIDVTKEQEQIAQNNTVDKTKRQVDQAAAQVAGDVNAPVAESEQVTKKPLRLPTVRQVHVLWTLRLLDTVIIFSAVMYCLTILFALKISMVGRLGGINHISRAFFWSLIFLVLIIPWQVALGWGLYGMAYEPSELMRRIGEYDTYSIFLKALYWMRFVGLWVIALLCLLFAQGRTARWSKSTLKRLEVI